MIVNQTGSGGITIRLMRTPEECRHVQLVQKHVWQSSGRDLVPAHVLITVNKNGGVLLGAIAALFGLSRVYAGVFYPLDVVAGAAIGVGVSLAVSVALRLVEPLPTLVLRLARTLYLA